MPALMRCLYCGLLQDEPAGVKACQRCGGELVFETGPQPDERGSYLQAQLELDQVQAPAGRNVDRYLLVTLRTPSHVPSDQAAPTEIGRSPLNFTAVLDVSGSMQGQKLAQAKHAVRQALHHLHTGDIISLVIFNNEVRCVVEPTVFSDQSLNIIESALQEIIAGGMTALDGGLAMGIEKTAQSKQATNLVLLLSDGLANVGETDLEIIGQRGFSARQQGMIISTLGVGGDYNEALMVEIATQGGGRFYHVLSADQITAYLTGELGEMAALAARETQINLVIPPGAALVPLSAAYPAHQAGDQVVVLIGDIPSDLEMEIPLRLTLFAQPEGLKLSVHGKVNYRSPAGNLLSTQLNRVTVRFVEQVTYSLRAGVVMPVAERVFDQMKAVYLINFSRARARSGGAGVQQSEAGLANLREYATLLGEERAQEELREMDDHIAVMQTSPTAAKDVVYPAFMRMRSSRDF